MTISHSRFDEQQLYCIVKEVGPCDVVQVARTTIFLSLLVKPKDARAARGLPSDFHSTWVTVKAWSHTQHAVAAASNDHTAVSSFGDAGLSCCPAGCAFAEAGPVSLSWSCISLDQLDQDCPVQSWAR